MRLEFKKLEAIGLGVPTVVLSSAEVPQNPR